MLHNLFVCAEINGVKLNYEITFTHRPSLRDIDLRVREVFSVALMDANLPTPFVIGSIAKYDEARDHWEEVVTEAQLAEGCQLYVFQPPGAPGVTDAPGPLPAPTLPPSAIPPRVDSEANVSRPVGLSVNSLALDGVGGLTLHETFDMIDTNRDGRISLRELRDAMLVVEMDVTPRSVGDTFLWGDQTVNEDQFCRFGASYPQVVRELHYRMLQLKASRSVPKWEPPVAPPTLSSSQYVVQPFAPFVPPLSSALPQQQYVELLQRLDGEESRCLRDLERIRRERDDILVRMGRQPAPRAVSTTPPQLARPPSLGAPSPVHQLNPTQPALRSPVSMRQQQQGCIAPTLYGSSTPNRYWSNSTVLEQACSYLSFEDWRDI